jgi:hypothetical protein
MTVSVSAVLLLAGAAVFLLRKDGLKPVHLIVCVLLGFYLASTSIAPSIRQGAATVGGFFSGLKF